jgi:hypothetical protein
MTEYLLSYVCVYNFLDKYESYLKMKFYFFLNLLPMCTTFLGTNNFLKVFNTVDVNCVRIIPRAYNHIKHLPKYVHAKK